VIFGNKKIFVATASRLVAARQNRLQGESIAADSWLRRFRVCQAHRDHGE
jgi:hypothetical protein